MSGVTETMKQFTKQYRWRTVAERDRRPRDRSLRGKARIKARRK